MRFECNKSPTQVRIFEILNGGALSDCEEYNKFIADKDIEIISQKEEYIPPPKAIILDDPTPSEIMWVSHVERDSWYIKVTYRKKGRI